MSEENNELAPDWLLASCEIAEQPFRSKVPFLGPLIVWVRTAWNNMAARWYVRPLIDQQNRFNRLLVERLREYETYTYDLSSEQDHELTLLRHDVAVVQTHLRGLRQQLAALDRQLAGLEAGNGEAEAGDGGQESANDRGE